MTKVILDGAFELMHDDGPITIVEFPDQFCIKYSGKDGKSHTAWSKYVKVICTPVHPGKRY